MLPSVAAAPHPKEKNNCCELSIWAFSLATIAPGRVKIRSDFVVIPCGAQIFAFIRSPCAHTPQKSWCAFTARSFHTAWTRLTMPLDQRTIASDRLHAR
jgi:hypothetical protein